MLRVTYEEASSLLGKSYNNFRHVIAKGVFTVIADRDRKYLIKEQVLLFKGKKQLSLRSLTSKELKLWEKYRDEATKPTPPTPPKSPSFNTDEISAEISNKVILKVREDLASIFAFPTTLQEAQAIQNIASPRLETSRQLLGDETWLYLLEGNVEKIALLLEQSGRFTHDEALEKASIFIELISSIRMLNNDVSNQIKTIASHPLETHSNAS